MAKGKKKLLDLDRVSEVESSDGDGDGDRVNARRSRSPLEAVERRVEVEEKGSETRKKSLERKRERKDKSRKRAHETDEAAGSTGLDRVKGGRRDLYVVCTDVRKEVRKVKKEITDDELVRGIEGATGMSVDGRMEEALEDDGVILERECTEEMRTIGKGLRSIVLDDSNKITRWCADKILDQASHYEVLMRRILLENARLRGLLDAQTSVSRVEDGLKDLSVRIERMQRDLNAAARGGSPDRPTVGVGRAPRVERSYALVVRGTNEGMSADEVGKRVKENVSETAVRVRSMRPVRGGGGVVIETPSVREREVLSQCVDLERLGLRASEPTRLNPRIVVYGVPESLDDNALLNGLFQKNLSEVLSESEYRAKVKIVRRIRANGKPLSRVIVELPPRCRDKVLESGRIYVEWASFRVAPWEHVLKCFKCLRFGHRARECQREAACFKCGGAGHRATACTGNESCVNCKENGLPHGHATVSHQCPLYVRRVNVLRFRTANG